MWYKICLMIYIYIIPEIKWNGVQSYAKLLSSQCNIMTPIQACSNPIMMWIFALCGDMLFLSLAGKVNWPADLTDFKGWDTYDAWIDFFPFEQRCLGHCWQQPSTVQYYPSLPRVNTILCTWMHNAWRTHHPLLEEGEWLRLVMDLIQFIPHIFHVTIQTLYH